MWIAERIFYRSDDELEVYLMACRNNLEDPKATVILTYYEEQTPKKLVLDGELWRIRWHSFPSEMPRNDERQTRIYQCCPALA